MVTRGKAVILMAVIGLALALSTAAKLRFPGLPVGLSELFLLLCMVLHLPLGFGVHGGNQPNRFVPALLLLVLATLPGFFVTLTQEGIQPFTLHALTAMVWILILFSYVHFGFDYKRNPISLLIKFFLVFSSAYFASVLALAVFDPPSVYREDSAGQLGFTEATDVAENFEQVFRLTGFSTDPNQLALHALVCLFFTLHLYRSNGFFSSVVYALLAVTVGVLAKSDSFLFAMVALFGVAITMGIVFRGSIIGGLVILVPTITGLLLFRSTITNGIQEIASTGDQDSVRLDLWNNGIAAALERPFVGLGPGAWSGLDAPREGWESHNSAIEFFTYSGLLGATILLCCLIALLLKSVIEKQPVILAGILALMVFATFHNVIRHPVVWLTLYYMAQILWSSRKTKARAVKRVRSKNTVPSRGLEF